MAKKEGYRYYTDGHSEISIKCMRSRTLGTSKVKELAPKLSVDEKALAVHNYQYVPADFDFTITSISNAFYRADDKSGLTEFNPTKSEIGFFPCLNPSSSENLKDFTFPRMYIPKSSD